ncbi:MAG: 16S rRNA (cytosine(1402)-N(4))-methyltransferase RsmH [Spirochaetes bacterium]|nr:16S rRNA (cytosine(1402)-N(4))-methyltransferase RsmH [Spirochaetota bacterium]
MYYHKPVMPAEVLKYLAVTADNVYIDCTTGEGGHSELILKNYKVKQLICIEQDKELLRIAEKRLKEYSNVLFINGNFNDLKNIVIDHKIRKIDGLLFDLGLSMFHYKGSSKGFSFEQDVKLDMRLNPSIKVSAYDIINLYSDQELRKTIWAYGEERWTNLIVKQIVKKRARAHIRTTGELRNLIEETVPRKFWKKGLHPATRTFQALRIAVNQELFNLEEVLKDSIKVLSKNGRIAVISYHSLEDRIVKNFFRLYSKGYDDTGMEHQDNKGILKVLTKKPIKADAGEIRNNRSARSAKLRCAQLIKG